MTSHDPHLYARSFADVYDAWYGDDGEPDVIAQALRSVTPPPATIVELGSGSGRLTRPLVSAGYRVIALDSSTQMLLADDSGSARVGADMASLPLRTGSIDIAVIAWNTFFNLSSIPSQDRCLHQVARSLSSGGRLAIDAFISSVDRAGWSSRPHPTDPDGGLLLFTGERGPDAVLEGAHVEVTTAGIRARPWRLAYRSPLEIERAAAVAGLRLEQRWADWSGPTRAPDGLRHVSWFTKT